MAKRFLTLFVLTFMLITFALPTFASTGSSKTDTSPNKPTAKAVVEKKEPKLIVKSTEKIEETKASKDLVLTLTAGKDYAMKNHAEGIVYLSSDPLVASISKTGEVKALKAGKCIFTRINLENKEATYNVVVEGSLTSPQSGSGEITSVNSKETLEMVVGHLYKLSNHKAGVTYKFSDADLLTINSEGVMSPNKIGKGSVVQLVDDLEITYPVIISPEAKVA